MNILERVEAILHAEADAIRNLPVGKPVEDAVRLLLGCKGKVFTTGIGKAGYIARKAASTFSTTGTPSVFIHPGDAPHGDVGVVSSNDILLAFSNSGKTREVIETVHFCKRLKLNAVISITMEDGSPLSQESDVTLVLGHITEPCPLGLTPSASAAAMAAMADALALATLAERGFTKEDFALRHHGGYLGKKSREEL